MPVRRFCWVTALVYVCISVLLNIGVLEDLHWKLVVLRICGNIQTRQSTSLEKLFLHDYVCVLFGWKRCLNLKSVSRNNSPQENIILFYSCDVLTSISTSHLFEKKNCDREILLERQKLLPSFEGVKCIWGEVYEEASVRCRHKVNSEVQHYLDD